MRYPEGHKEQVRERIVRAAATALRRDGLDGVSIPALMREVGLTHGGFYAHFANRDALVAEAILAAADQTARGTFGDELPWSEVVQRYVSAPHVAEREGGCVLAALGTEGSRQPPLVKQAFATVAHGFLALAQQKLRPRAPGAPLDDDALVRASTMLGAVILARLVRDPQLADRILAAARRQIDS